MLEEMKGFNKCLFISGHIKEDKGVLWKIRQPKKETRKEYSAEAEKNFNEWKHQCRGESNEQGRKDTMCALASHELTKFFS